MKIQFNVLMYYEEKNIISSEVQVGMGEFKTNIHRDLHLWGILNHKFIITFYKLIQDDCVLCFIILLLEILKRQTMRISYHFVLALYFDI